MEDLTDLTLENEELKKEIKQMRAEMDKMSESMWIMEKQNAEGTSTVKQMTQMFEAMQKSAEKRSTMDTTETAATPDYPPGFTQGLMPVTVHLNKPCTTNAKGSRILKSPHHRDRTTNVVGVTTTPSAQQVFNSVTPSSQEKGSAAAVLGVTPAQNVQWFPWQQATNFGMPNQSMVFGAATGERVENGLKSGKIASDTPTMNNSKKPASGPQRKREGETNAVTYQPFGGPNYRPPHFQQTFMPIYLTHSLNVPKNPWSSTIPGMQQLEPPIDQYPSLSKYLHHFPTRIIRQYRWRYDVEVLVGDRQTSFQALEIAHATYEKPIVESQPSDALMMVARVMLENGYQYGRGLGRYGQGMFVEEKEEKRLARLGGREPRTGGVPICDIRESFISAGFEHSNLIAAAEGHTQGDVKNNWVRVGPPNAKLPNWEIVELPVIFNFK
ncbi:hypothetical protein SESBI_14998 [Sesbania bispinosa]|nr:hypothetical protein SESBI_14998 [Sesbania bispinosa]